MIASRLLLTACLLPVFLAASADEKFDTEAASFAVTFHDETTAYRDAAVIVPAGRVGDVPHRGRTARRLHRRDRRRHAHAAGTAAVDVDRARSSGHLSGHVRTVRERRTGSRCTDS